MNFNFYSLLFLIFLVFIIAVLFHFAFYNLIFVLYKKNVLNKDDVKFIDSFHFKKK